MKFMLLILLCFSVNTGFAQAHNEAPDSNSTHSGDKTSFFGGLFGKSKAAHKQEIKLINSELDRVIQNLGQLEDAFEAYKKDSNLKIENLQSKITENSNNLEKAKGELALKLNRTEKTLGQSLVELEKETRQSYEDTNTHYNSTEQKIEDLHRAINLAASTLETATNKLNEEIGNTTKATINLGESVEGIKKDTTESIADVDKEISKNMLYWLVSILVIALVLLVLYTVLKTLIKKYRLDAISGIQETRRVLEEESVQLDNKLIEVIETQLSIVSSDRTSVSSEKDHSLALKVADEIVRIQKNISRMDKNIKGLKQLAASVKRIQDNFSSNGYEIVEMLGKPYNEGMKVSASLIPDEDLDEGQEVITRIIKPQVNYQGVMIQSAQIEVSIGE